MRAAILATLVLSTAAHAAVDPSPGFADARAELESSLTPAGRVELAAHADLPLYRIHARWDAERRLLTGTADIEWRNASTAPVRDLGFATFPDCACYDASSLVLERVRVDGRPASAPRAVADGAGTLVDLAQPIAPGAWAEIEVPFALAPSRLGGYHGLGSDQGSAVCLYGWYPALAARVGDHWDLHPLGGLCDPTSSTMSHVVAWLELPSGAELVSGGSEERGPTDGRWTSHAISAPFTRDLALVIADRLDSARREVGGTTVTSWWLPGDEPGGRAALDIAARSLELYAERFGPYPYAELDAAQVPLGEDVGGMESSGLVLIDSACYRSLRHAGDDPPPMAQLMMALCVSHEVGHQWFYGLVGSDAWTEAWLDESLTNWVCCWYLEKNGGPLAEAGWNMSLAECMPRSALRMPATLDAGSYAEEDYGAVIYGRGALMYQALRHRLGDEAFFAFLRRWSEAHRFGTATGADWRAALAEALGEADAAAFAATWLDAKGLTRRDFTAAVRPAPAKPSTP